MKRTIGPTIAAALLMVTGSVLAGCEKNVKKPEPVVTPPEMTIVDVDGMPFVTSVTVQFKAAETAASYAYAIGTADDLASFEAGTIEGYTVVDEDVQRENTVTFSGLEPETEYTVFAQAADSDGNKGGVATRKLSTMAAPVATVAIVETGASTSSVTVSFEASEQTAGYFYAIGTASDLGAFEAGELEGYTYVDEDVHTIRSVTFDGLDDDTEYAVFARGVNEYGMAGKTASLVVTTAEIPEPAITAEIVKLNCTIATVKYTLNETARGGIAAFLPIDTYNKLNTSYGEFMEQILTMASIGAGAITYEQDTEFTWYIRSKPEQEFVMVNVILYRDEQGEDQLRLETRSVFTPAFDPWAPEAGVDVEILTNERYKLELKFTTNDATYCLQHAIMSKAVFDMVLTNPTLLKQIYDDLLLNGRTQYAGTSTYLYDHTGKAGIKGGDVTYVIAILYNDNGASEEIKILETFTVPN